MTAEPIVIRSIDDYAGMKRAVEFQRLIWGADFDEVVPAVILMAATRTGGILAGAFDPRGAMVGLLFGMTGWDGIRPLHWSDMMGVLPAVRGRGVGLALKRFQRDRLLENGVTAATWTFDPLEARNAHLNFAKLGVTAREYVRDCYGESNSPLHRGIGTDRLVVSWALDSDRVRSRMEGGDATSPIGDVPVVNPPAGELRSAAGGPVVDAALRLDLDDRRVAVRIPPDIQSLKGRDPAGARRWRDQTRSAFEAYLGRGYIVMDLERGEGESRYILERGGRGHTVRSDLDS